MGITRNHPYVIVTDLANYFDSIPLHALRNRIASFGAFNETTLDFLFFLLDAFTWRPFYMPQSGVGLPQLNFDAPRLLAHAYLFPVDSELQRQTNGEFVRWMDDINCGVASIASARRLLQSLEILLNSLGLRLNTGKTKILSVSGAMAHFWITENQAITTLTNLAKQANPGGPTWNGLRTYARKRYRAFRNRGRAGNWDKICKRYYTLFGLLGESKLLQPDTPSLLRDEPSLRDSICRYYLRLGPSNVRLAHLELFLKGGQCLDDASLFEVVRTFVAWKGQTRGSRRDKLVKLAPIISQLGSHTTTHRRLTVAGVSSAGWLLSKYGTSSELAAFLRSSDSVWSSWAARQVAAALPLLAKADRDFVHGRIIQSGLVEAFRVLASIDQLGKITTLDQQLKSYLFHPSTPEHPYPLSKVIVARVLLRGLLSRAQKRSLRASLLKIVSDPSYSAIITRRP